MKLESASLEWRFGVGVFAHRQAVGNRSGRRRRFAAAALVVSMFGTYLAVGAAQEVSAAAGYALPFECGRSGWHASTREGHEQNSNALDFNMAGEDRGQPVVASADGVVVHPAYDSKSGSNPLAIDHDGGGIRSGAATVYLHMNVSVANGARVKRGDVIGYVNNIGAPAAPRGGYHLHYEQRVNWVAQRAVFTNWVPDYGPSMFTDGIGPAIPASDNCASAPQLPPAGVYVSTCNLGGADRCTGVNLRSAPTWPGGVTSALGERTVVTPLCWTKGYQNRDASGTTSDNWAWVRAANGQEGYVNFLYLFGSGFTVFECNPLLAAAGNTTLTGDLRDGGQARVSFPLTNRGYFRWAPSAALVGIRTPSGAVRYQACEGVVPQIAKDATWTCNATISLNGAGAYQAWFAYDDASGRHDKRPEWDRAWLWDFRAAQSALVGVKAETTAWDPHVGGQIGLRHVVRNAGSSTTTFPAIFVTASGATNERKACGTNVTLAAGQEFTCDTTFAVRTAGNVTASLGYTQPDGRDYAGPPLFTPAWSFDITQLAQPRFTIIERGIDHMDPVVGGRFQFHYTVRNNGQSRGRVLLGGNFAANNSVGVHVDSECMETVDPIEFGVILEPGQEFRCEIGGTFPEAGYVRIDPQGFHWEIGPQMKLIASLFENEPPLAEVRVLRPGQSALRVTASTADEQPRVGQSVGASYTVKNFGSSTVRIFPSIAFEPTDAVSTEECVGVNYSGTGRVGVEIRPGASWTCVLSPTATLRHAGTLTARPYAWELGAGNWDFLGILLESAEPIATWDIPDTPVPPPETSADLDNPGVVLSTSASNAPRAENPSFISVVPERLLDSRSGVGYSGPKPGSGRTVELRVTGAGRAAVPSDASAVVLNVTGVGATTGGFVTVWPCGSPRPTTSNLNLTAGATSPNLVISKIGTDGKVCLYTSGGTHLLADIAGYHPTG